MAADVFNEAARRSGLKLQWLPTQNVPLDDLLSQHKVDMWPLAGSTSERRQKFYLTSPWLESDYVLLSLLPHPIRNGEAAVGKTVAHGRFRMTSLIAERFLSGSRLLVKLTRPEAIQAVCRGEAEGALVEGWVLDSVLLSRPAGCESVSLNVSALTGATTPLGIVAVPEARREADIMRAAIDELIATGYLARKLDESSPFSAGGARSIWARQESNQRNTTYRWLLSLILSLATVLAWLALRALRLRRVAEAAQTGLREAQRRFTAFMDNSPAISFMKDAQGRTLYVNRSWLQTFQRTPDECYGKDDFQLWPAPFARQVRTVDLELLEENRPRQVVEQIPVGSDTRDFLVVKFPFASETGERFVGGTAIDITERQSAIRDLAESEARYRELFENNPLPAWVYDRKTLRFLMVNAAATGRYGWSREQFLSGMTLTSVLAPELGRVHSGLGISGTQSSDPGAIDAAHSTPGSWLHQTRTGARLTVEITSYEMTYEGHAARLMIVRDMTEQERTFEQLRVSEQRWQLALHGTGDGLWDWDIVRGTVFRSPRWRSMLGYCESEVGETREDFFRLLHPDDVERTEQNLGAYLARETSSYTVEYRLRHRDGGWRWIMDRGQAVWDENNKPLRMVGSLTDITDRKTAEEILEREARTDALTSLPNRREFDRLLAMEFTLAGQAGVPLTVCVCDLDRFKLVNDTWGHAAGDRVIVAFAQKLREHLRQTDFAGRLGGDEFIIAMPGTSVPAATALVNRIRESFAAVSFLEGSGIFHVTCSFGVAQLGPRHRDEHLLLADADRHLYEAKESGRNRILTAV